MADFILASQSPRRRELLAMFSLSFDCVPADIDETPLPDESPYDFVSRMALEKAQAVQTQFPNALILASDTAVVVDNEIWGKPLDKADFQGMMNRLSGRSHQVMSSVALIQAQQSELSVNLTEVTFRHLSPAEIEAYWQSGEPADKAGGYGIQGLASLFIEQIQGSFHGVMGLPLHEVDALMKRFGKQLLS